MRGDIGLGIDMAPNSRIAKPAASKVPPQARKRTSSVDKVARRRNTVDEGDSLVSMRSSKGMAGLLLAEVGGSMVEMNRLGGRLGSNFKEGNHIGPGALAPIGHTPTALPLNNPKRPRPLPRSVTEHRRGMSLDQGLTRQGTLLSTQTSPIRRAAELKVLLGDSSSKVKSGAIVSSQQVKSKKSPNAVAFEHGRSRVRVALDMDLENNVAVEGGFISGTLMFRVRPKKKEELLSLGGGKIRIAGFEVAPGNEDRYIFYQTTMPLVDISNVCDGLYSAAIDDEGFGSVGDGEYEVQFSMKIPQVSTGGKPRGVLNSRSGATIKYIIIASMKVVDPVTGKRSIAHFYRDCEIWPALDPVSILTPAPEPMLARASKKLFMGGDGLLSLTASSHRCTWVAGQPAHVRLRIVNDTRKTVRNIALVLVRTTTLFNMSTRSKAFSGDLDAEETSTSEKRIAEDVLSAGQKGAKGHASARGWWTGVGPGETRNVSHSITIPPDALTIPRARLVEVDYAIRVSLCVSSIAGNSEAVHVTLPIRIVNFISLDPPSSTPVLPSSSSSVIELDTPRPEAYSRTNSHKADNSTLSPSWDSSGLVPHLSYLDPENDATKSHNATVHRMQRDSSTRKPYGAPLPALPTSHTLHDLGGVEDANDLNNMLGDIPGSASILEETGIALDSGYSSAFSNRSYYDQGFASEGYSYGSNIIGEEYEDEGSDEELERMVGCASARIDVGAFQYAQNSHQVILPEQLSSRSASRSSEQHEPSFYERPVDTSEPRRWESSHGVRGPRIMGTGQSTNVGPKQHSVSYDGLGTESISATRSMIHVTDRSGRTIEESPSSVYSAGIALAQTTRPSFRASPSKSLNSSPSKKVVQPLIDSRPSVPRALTAPADATRSADSYNTGLGMSASATCTGISTPDTKSGGMSSVRARIAMLEQQSREQEGPSNTNVRPGYVSRSMTTSSISMYT